MGKSSKRWNLWRIFAFVIVISLSLCVLALSYNYVGALLSYTVDTVTPPFPSNYGTSSPSYNGREHVSNLQSSNESICKLGVDLPSVYATRLTYLHSILSSYVEEDGDRAWFITGGHALNALRFGSPLVRLSSIKGTYASDNDYDMSFIAKSWNDWMSLRNRTCRSVPKQYGLICSPKTPWGHDAKIGIIVRSFEDCKNPPFKNLENFSCSRLT
eukprot:384415_1